MIRPEANGKRFILDGDEPSVAVNGGGALPLSLVPSPSTDIGVAFFRRADIIAKCRELFPVIQFGDAPGPKGWDTESFGKQPARSGTDNSLSRTVLGIDYISSDQVCVSFSLPWGVTRSFSLFWMCCLWPLIPVELYSPHVDVV